MVNNYTQIRKIVKNNFLNHPGSFHLVQVLTRGKDLKEIARRQGEPEPGAANQTIKNYIIYDLGKFDRYWPEIQKLCEVFNARAYIWLQPRSIKKLNQRVIADLSINMVNGNDVNPLGSIVSCVGEMIPEERMWVVDVDEKKYSYLESVIGTIRCLAGNEEVIKHIIPTASGYHVLTGKFNTREFGKTFPDIDLHKNNPTILYIPSSITKLYEEK